MDTGMMPGVQQGRNKDSNDKWMIDSRRDIARITPCLMQLTTDSFYENGAAHDDLLSAVTAREKLLDIAFGYALTKKEMLDKFGEMCVAIGKDFCQGFLRGQRTFTEAWDAAKLAERYPRWMLDLWLTHFSHTVISAFYYGVRDVMIQGQPDPMNWDQIFDSAEEIRRKINGS